MTATPLGVDALDDDQPGRLTELEVTAGPDDGTRLLVIDPARATVLVVVDPDAAAGAAVVRYSDTLTAEDVAAALRDIAEGLHPTP